MDVKAAVAFASGKPLSIETVQLAPPQEGEALKMNRFVALLLLNSFCNIYEL